MVREVTQPEFENVVRSGQKMVVLFYASWCPFSRMFLPVYEKCTTGDPTTCVRIMIDDCPDLCDKYEIVVYPTVIVFENGQVVERLDGEPHQGLKEQQLKKLLEKI
jgi:thioredoxin 1